MYVRSGRFVTHWSLMRVAWLAVCCLLSCESTDGRTLVEPDAAPGAVVDAGRGETSPPGERVRVILDTDANNELDDQHAIAYALFSADVFEVEGITVNRTLFGGGIGEHVAEAERVARLCGAPDLPVLAGAEGGFEEIAGTLSGDEFDGHAAVDFIIERAHANDSRRLTLLPIGKLTNVALALRKDPSILQKVRVVWLGSNWPTSGEYNLENDRASVSYVVESGVELEIAVVRYSEPSGTAAVKVTAEEIQATMPGLGPRVAPPVEGRSGGAFGTFGDYSVELFRAAGNTERALFDVAAVAIAKNGLWATATTVPAPEFSSGAWEDRPGAKHTITFRESFDRERIVADFYATMRDYRLP
jgi:inosine-uridine nucleoside N-ribohydrolase